MYTLLSDRQALMLWENHNDIDTEFIRGAYINDSVIFYPEFEEPQGLNNSALFILFF